MRDVKRIGIVGTGTMGEGIAYQAIMNEFEAWLYDVQVETLEQAVEKIARLVKQQSDRGRILGDLANILERLRTVGVLGDLCSCDFIIEAVTEDLAVKHSVFQELDAVCAPDVVLATNTSAKSITEISAAATRPERVVGMHFFNPVHRMELVEVVQGLESADWAVEQTEAVGRRLGKETIRVNERPGVVTSRISALVGNEAFYMLMEGVSSAEEIDKAIKQGLHFPMGPFELGDLVGWDTRLHVLEYLHQSLGEKFRPCPLLVQYVRAGRLGKKVGRGVYEYDEQGRRIPGSASSLRRRDGAPGDGRNRGRAGVHSDE
ncbi:3-hydroxybutyryl-CoA dehydrogenase [Kyrpidia spormannii]|uniref:3-hydroxybutyryl-CoA dehydrogenase n=1 Tax=Kyrpidia spormannii TaxID=2055160 RepID=A0A2K8N5B0_9BACL|nr:3-hydroxyacyl-CoA dehydrogenase NAD-binding domain-containing protein [Kyrpidia spormannii]ATY84539.1 3-hydroxybutyryl-CoA dehydrogenase [Kyrpidia spormannii]